MGYGRFKQKNSSPSEAPDEWPPSRTLFHFSSRSLGKACVPLIEICIASSLGFVHEMHCRPGMAAPRIGASCDGETAPGDSAGGLLDSALADQLSMQPPLLHSPASRLRPSVSAAGRNVFSGGHERLDVGEIRNPILRLFGGCFVRRSAKRRQCKKREFDKPDPT
jgi:hypothetical protein